VAQKLGGGGHRLAAGYTASEGLDESIRQLIEALPTANA
jgi:nanoRNase/pAp phosphatase (c-di-AMP/oligoRNAs hydrolase)